MLNNFLPLMTVRKVMLFKVPRLHRAFNAQKTSKILIIYEFELILCKNGGQTVQNHRRLFEAKFDEKTLFSSLTVQSQRQLNISFIIYAIASIYL